MFYFFLIFTYMKQKFDEFRQYAKCRVCGKNNLRNEMIGKRCPECVPTEKACTKCGITKPLGDFTKRNTCSADGRTSECKACLNRRLKVKKIQGKDSIIVRNPYREGSIQNEIFGFFGQHQLKLSEEEVKLICSELRESKNKLSTLDKILARYKVGIDDYIVEFHHKAKAVLQFELDDIDYLNPIGRFESSTEACLFIKGNKDARGSITQACRTGMTAIGYRWKFKESEE